MIKKYLIYALVDQNDHVFYVGTTSQNINARISQHRPSFGEEINYKIIDTISGTKEDAFEAERMWIQYYLSSGTDLKNKLTYIPEETKPVRLDKDVVKDLKKFVGNNGGTIKGALEHGAIWVMSKGAKEYINKLKK